MSNRSIVALKFVVFPACLIPLGVACLPRVHQFAGSGPGGDHYPHHRILDALFSADLARRHAGPSIEQPSGMAHSLSAYVWAVCFLLRHAAPDDLRVAILQL